MPYCVATPQTSFGYIAKYIGCGPINVVCVDLGKHCLYTLIVFPSVLMPRGHNTSTSLPGCVYSSLFRVVMIHCVGSFTDTV